MSCKCNEINDRCFQLTGYINTEELLNAIESLTQDFLFDERDDDNYTVPLIEQIRSRLNILEELEN